MTDLTTLQYIQVFDEHDCGLLDILCAQYDDGNTPADIVAQHYAGTLNCFRVGDGLVLTQTQSEGSRQELVVYGLIGRGILRQADGVCTDLRLIAARFECQTIGGNVSRPGLRRLYEKLGAKPVSVYYQMEIV